MNEKLFYTVEETAQLLALHPETVRRMIRRGELGAVKVARRLRVPLDALNALGKNEVKAAP